MKSWTHMQRGIYAALFGTLLKPLTSWREKKNTSKCSLIECQYNLLFLTSGKNIVEVLNNCSVYLALLFLHQVWQKFGYLFIFMSWPQGLWDLSSPARERTLALAVKAPSPNHWTTREFPQAPFLLEAATASALNSCFEQQCSRAVVFKPQFMIHQLAVKSTECNQLFKKKKIK